MDNLTHSLVGLFLSRVGLNRISPDTTAVTVVAANLPDADIISGLGGAPAYLEWHRGITHSLAGSPFVAFAALLMVRAFTRRRERWAASWLAAWVAVLSHIVLDLTNDYGVRVFAPFNESWFHWDFSYVIDPWIWTGLVLAAFAPMLARLVSSEIGKRPKAYPSRVWPAVGLIFLFSWDLGRWILHERAMAVLNARIYGNDRPADIAAFATPVRPWEWDALVETSDRAFLYELDLTGYFDPDQAKYFYRAGPGPALVALRRQPGFSALIGFSQYPLWRVEGSPEDATYRLTDLRFGDPVRGTFTCSARVLRFTAVADERCNFTFQSNFSR